MVNSSVVLPPWKCPDCGHANVHTTARCMNRSFDQESPRFHAVAPVPSNYSLKDLGEYFEKLGLVNTPRPAVTWRCPYVHPCLKPDCEAPGRAYPHGIRCVDHRDLMSFEEEAT